MAAERVELKHATCIAIGDAAVLLVGPSGAGKSDLALRCLALAQSRICPEPFILVSDDQTQLHVADGRLMARAPTTIAGKLEVRGLGIVDTAWRDEAEVILVANLTQEPLLRLPDENNHEVLLGVAVARTSINPFTASAPLQVALALQKAVSNT